MSSVNASPVSRSSTTTRTIPCRHTKRSSWPRSWVVQAAESRPCASATGWPGRTVSEATRARELGEHPRSSSCSVSGNRVTITGRPPVDPWIVWRGLWGNREVPPPSRKKGLRRGNMVSPRDEPKANDDHLLTPVSRSSARLREIAPVLAASCHQPSTRCTARLPRRAYSRLTSVISSSPRLDGTSPPMISNTSGGSEVEAGRPRRSTALLVPLSTMPPSRRNPSRFRRRR